MVETDRQTDIIGTLYKDEVGDIMLLNDAGAHAVVIEQRDHSLPQKTREILFVVSHEVTWEDGTIEIWASDLWEDFIFDTNEESGEDGVKRVEKFITSTFQSVILTVCE
jgi:hypothetical protein